jgi:hypothetical protein
MFVAGLTTLIDRRSKAAAQFTTQEVRNGLQVTSTGDVRVDQSASGNQEVGVFIDGRVVTEDGIYRDGSTQVVINDGQITSTGDVDVRQAASGTQQVTTVVRRQDDWYNGMQADACSPGQVLASPNGVLFYQRDDCCFYEVPCIPCKQECNGDRCGNGK